MNGEWTPRNLSAPRPRDIGTTRRDGLHDRSAGRARGVRVLADADREGTGVAQRVVRRNLRRQFQVLQLRVPHAERAKSVSFSNDRQGDDVNERQHAFPSLEKASGHSRSLQLILNSGFRHQTTTLIRSWHRCCDGFSQRGRNRPEEVPMIEFRWIAALALWTLLIGPVADIGSGQSRLKARTQGTRAAH